MNGSLQVKAHIAVVTVLLLFCCTIGNSSAFLPQSTTNQAKAFAKNPFVQQTLGALSDLTETLKQPSILPLPDLLTQKLPIQLQLFGKNEDEGSTGGGGVAAVKNVETPTELLARLGITLNFPQVGFVAPEKRFDIAAAAMPFILRLGSGSFCEGYQVGFTKTDESKYVPYNIKLGDKFQLYEKSKYDDNSSRNSNRQARGPIVIYEFEACPFCRKVREAVSILSLDVEFRPTPQGSVYREEIKKKYGRKATFPFMMDPNTGIEMFESDDIIKYLFRAYGSSEDGNVPKSLSPDFTTTLMTGLSLLFRFGKGSKVKDSNPPKQPLVLWTAEGTPFGKLVREELNELQIAHQQISCPRGSANRQRMFEQTGRFQIPYLEDPNTGVKLFESSSIVEYLQKMYGVSPTTVEYM